MNEMMLSDILVFLGLTIGMGCFTGIVVTWIKWRRNKLPAANEISARLAEISERLAHLENAVDASAVEIERISEAQRFTTKLLASSKEQPDSTR
ncbi:MAG TPA: hypothetical protein VHB25_15335 [Gemmatimonadaceae bacterium]|nr:hypothetical protein [Gemmatimonadaceae bacterium]